MNLALFDLDNTLLSGDSDYEWAQFLVSKGLVDKELQETKNNAFYADYKAGTLDIHAFLDFQLAPLARYTRPQLEAWHHEFMTRHIHPLISKKSVTLVRQHLDAGDLCAIVTATNTFVTGPISTAYNIEHLIGTIAQVDTVNGQFTGRPTGIPSFQEGKIIRVNAWLESMGLWWGRFERSYFYSDSHNDLPLMEKVSHPIAVDPDNKLREHAAKKAWGNISLRN